MDGLLLIDKPHSMTSARAVTTVKWLLPRRVRIGHGGTLDPFATGLLILLMGKATRQSESVMSWRKTYRTTIKLGATTASDDPDSPEQLHDKQSVSQTAIEETLKEFVGFIEQRPPLYSALKVRGRRACDRARAGQRIELQPRRVQIHSIVMNDYAWPLLKLEVECGRGTYIRALGRDIGQRLGVGGYLTELRRTRIGPFSDSDAVSPEILTRETVAQRIIPLSSVPWPDDAPHTVPDGQFR